MFLAAGGEVPPFDVKWRPNLECFTPDWSSKGIEGPLALPERRFVVPRSLVHPLLSFFLFEAEEKHSSGKRPLLVAAQFGEQLHCI
jgi:hypothetical protein